jgi:malonyl-CoA O-methyltransferase
LFANLAARLQMKLIGLLGGVKEPIPLDVLTGYAKWAQNYPVEAHNLVMAVEQQAMLELLPPGLSGKVCLDLGCGSGRYMRLLRQRQAAAVFGLDHSPHMLFQAAGNGLGGWLARSPFAALPFAGESFDLITCGLAVGHEANLAQLLREAARGLRPGGLLLYSDIHPFGALAGWQRTFTADDGTTYSLEHHPHLYGAHHRACQAAGLTIDAIREPAGRPPDQDPEDRPVPLVLVIRATKLA